MTFGNLMRGAMLGIALTGLATAAEATTFRLNELTISGSALNDPGLVVKTKSLAPAQFELNGVGDTAWVDLFEIWSEECCINIPDDWDPQQFSMQLSFDLPSPPFDGSNDGTTGFFLVPYLVWDDNSVLFSFGALGDGLLELTLFDTIFEFNCVKSYGIQTFGGGHHHGDRNCRTTVKGKFKLLAEATDVPEPAAIALLGTGLVGLGLLRRRRTA